MAAYQKLLLVKTLHSDPVPSEDMSLVLILLMEEWNSAVTRKSCPNHEDSDPMPAIKKKCHDNQLILYQAGLT